MISFCAFGQTTSQPAAAVLTGTVRNSAGHPISDATVSLSCNQQKTSLDAKTNTDGVFDLKAVPAANCKLKLAKSGFRDAGKEWFSIATGDELHLDFVLEPDPSSTMQLEDNPNFAVAGITDWTAAGGHGSDTNLRTSEALARETRALAPADKNENTARAQSVPASEQALRAAVEQSPHSFEANRKLGQFCMQMRDYRQAIAPLEAAYRINPADTANALDLARAYQSAGALARARQQLKAILAQADDADARRMLGDVDEQLDDSLAAVQEYERATRLDPSEQNYFSWGTELLLHRAVQPAVEVLTKGVSLHSKSERMLAALGAALYAGGSYEDAAQRICQASDLQPADPAPYNFMGEMEIAAPTPLPCIGPKLEGLVKEQPGNARAKYYLAMSIAKKRKVNRDDAGLSKEQSLLDQAIAIDPKLGEAHLQLGIVQMEQGRARAAVTSLQKAIAANLQIVEAHFRLARAYGQLGDTVQAQHELDIYERMRKEQAAEVERQRKQVRQFVIVLKGQPTASR